MIGRRPLSLLFTAVFTLALASAVHGQQTVSGDIVDQDGAPLPRVLVRLVDAAGAHVAQTFTDARGAFRLASSACRDCRVEASLLGFATASAPANGTPIRLTLILGPIEETVVVSATRGEIPSSQVGSSLTVFTADEIERRGTPLVADLLRETPGATIARSGGLGNVTSLFVRGGESSYNKVLLDGIPLNEPGGTFNFSNLTSDHLDRVEVVRGAYSALFGSDAMASVVQLVTRRARAGRPDARVSLEAGSYDTQRVAASIGGARGPVDASAHAARFDTDNRVPNNAFRNTTVAGNAGVAVSPDMAIRFVGRGELGRTGVPGATAFGRPDMDAFFVRRDGVGGVTFNHQASAAWHQRVTYALTVSHQESTNLLIDPPYVPRLGNREAPFEFDDFPYDSQNDLRRHHASYQSDWHVGTARRGDHLLTFALDWDGERGVLGDRLAGTAVRASRDNVGGTVQHQALGARASLTTGVRIERNDSFGTAVAPRVSLLYPVRRSAGVLGETTIKANAGAGVKEPTLLQSFSPNPGYLGNSELEPERARTIDAGVEQRFLRQRARVELIWFYGRFENIVSTQTLGFSPYRAQYFNVGLTRAQGTELAAEVAPGVRLRLRGGYTFLSSEVTRSTAPTNPVFAEGRPLFRRPRHSGFFNATWAGPRVSVQAYGAFIGERVDSDFSALVPAMLSNEGHAVWDLGGDWRMSRHLTWFGRVENIANAQYMDPVGYPAWGRTARAGVRVGF
jgi:outer membrane cobalamin receptor